MKRSRTWLAVALPLLAAALALALPGVAQAGWVWCNDPIVSVGNEQIGYTTVAIEFASDDGLWSYAPSVNMTVPDGMEVRVVDAQGSSVTWASDEDLRVSGNAMQTRVAVLVPPKGPSDSNTRIKVRVSAEGSILAQAVGSVGQVITLKPVVPVPGK